MNRKNDFDKKSHTVHEAMIEAENRAISEREKQEECECKDGMFPTTNRRKFLTGMAAIASTGTAFLSSNAVAATQSNTDHKIQSDPTKELGRPTNADGGYGSRSQFENEARWRYPTATRESSWTMTPLDKSSGIITPSSLHFERHHAGIPNINPAKHTLTVHGMVGTAKKFTMADLKRFPSVTRMHFIECSGNGLTEWKQPTLKTVQGTHGLTSTSEWTGVPVSTILRECGIEDGAAWVLAEGNDAAVMSRSVPIDKMWDDAILVYAQNGEALRPEQGYPLRLLLPGFEGNTCIKWLRRLEVSNKPFMTREETSKYTDLVKGGKARQFTLTMDAKSVITFPSGNMLLPGQGFYEITGLAWSGRGRIKRVDVSTDGGISWQTAELQTPILRNCHTRFRFPWQWSGKPAILQSRCTDETGYTQPTIKQLIDVRGLDGHPRFGSIYHNNGIQSWAVAADGSVQNVHHY
ncbi:Sulfur oxidation molybdopterin C protein [hydrothermal vent metagenome]|uniref:Sulfur oxidation molybdopterin C protein n=1 Tax=hydrothermal vent metagenome TaxID=652676 RepID=A0A3B0WFL7_9ZZZZ